MKLVLPAYREFPPPPAVRTVACCLWEHLPATKTTQQIVPDGCVDVIWLAERELVVAGADTGPRWIELPPGRRSTGIRLRPGAAGDVLGVPASHVCDRQVDSTHVWLEQAVELANSLAAAHPARRLGLLASAVSRRNARPDWLVLAAASRLAVGARVGQVAAELGVSERQLHRRTVDAIGYGPKTFARVARLRRLVSLEEANLASRALRAGYSSQAHMSEEVRRLTGMSAVRFLKDAVLTAG